MKRHASMNRVYRMVWNEHAGTMVAVAENVRGRGKRTARGLLLMSGLLAGVWCNAARAAPPVNQLPTGAQVMSGIASVTQSGNVMTVRQGSDKLLANWSSFNIGQDAKVQFVQPGSSSVALNRIADANPSQIFGQLSANGQVFLLNPSGIIFGASARVDVGALVASTLDLSSANFLAGNYQFVRTGNAGSISNQGSISTSGGAASVVALIAPQVSNSGSIVATGGNVALAAGDKVSLDFSGNGLIKVQVDQGTLNALSENKGLIQADGGVVLMTARAASDVMDAVVNNEGTIQARTLQNKGGRIMLLSDMTHGETRVGGTLDASAPQGGDGGFIETSAAHVKVSESARITTQAPFGKSGLWLIDPNDFTISPTGDMTGFVLGTALATSDVTIQTVSQGTPGGSGDIYVDEHVFIDAGVAAHTLSLQAERDIVFKANSAIDAQGNSAPISVLLQSNATDAVGGGAIVMLPSSGIYSKGGSITLSGGSNPATGYAVGRDGTGATGGVPGMGGGADAGNGIAIISATLNSAGGNIVLRGKSVSGGNTLNSAGQATADGVFINESGGVGSLIDGGTGTITINGLSTGTITAADFGHAVSVSANSKIWSASTSGISISISGDGSGVTATTGSFGVFSDGVIEATAGGNVNITGIGGPDVPYGFGIYINNGKVLASGGSITMNGTGLTYGLGMNNPSATGTIAAESTALANSMSLTSNSAMVLGGPISATGAVNLVSASGTEIQGLVTSTTGTVSLQTGSGPGVLDFGGAISAPSLLLDGAAFQLRGQPFSFGVPIDGSASGNTVGTLAANVTGNAGLLFMNTGNLTIGTVGATNGVTMSGAGFTAISTSGDLNIAQNVSSAYNGALTGGTATVLVAGNGSAAGNAAGGNITVTGSPVVSVGAGGNAGLFSSSIASSTGLATLISAGNFRYNSSFQLGLASGLSPDYTSTPGFTPTALGSGLYAVYREQPAVTLAITSPAITYGQVPSLGVTVTVGVLQNGDVAGVPLLLSPVNSTAGSLAAGTYSVAPPAGLSDLGYAVTSAPGSLTVNPASITAVTGITALNRAYDGSPAATINVGAAGFTGMLAGDVLSLAGGATGAFVDKNVGNAKTVNISGLALTGADGPNYTLASSTATASANITVANLSISGATAVNRAYDGTTNATVSGATLAGTVYAGDVVSLVSASSGLFADKNVGTGKAVSTTATLGGADAGNYTLAQPGGLSANITQAPISAITGVAAASRAYDGTTTVTLNTATAGFTGMVAGDALAAVGGVGAFINKNVGTGKTVNVSGLSLGGADAGNYTLTSSTATASANITAASISTVTGITASNRVYDGSTAATLNTAAVGFTGMVAGDVLALAPGSLGAFANKNVGVAKAVNISGLGLTGVDAGNYTLTSSSATASANITAASLTISGATAQNKLYDGTTSATINGATLAGTVYAGDVVSLVGASSGLFADKNVGTGKAVSTAVSLSGASAANYTLAQPTGLSANITAASLTISGATAQNKVYDGNNSATVSGATLAGTVYAGDVVSLVGASSGLFADKNVGTGKAVSTAASLSGASAANYTLAQPTGLSANITAASLTISGATAQNKVYDGTTSATINGATLAGTVYAGDVVNLANASSGSFADPNVGTAKTVSMAATLSGTGVSNYALIQPTGLTADVTNAAPSAGLVVTQLAPATQSPVSITTSTALLSSSAQQVGLISFGVGITPATPAAPNTTAGTAPAAGSTSSTASSTTPASATSNPTASTDTSDSKSNTGSVPSGSASGSATATQDQATGLNSSASTPAATPPATASASGSQGKVASGKAAAKGTSKSAAVAPASAVAKAVAKAAPTRAGNPAVRPLPGNLNAALAGKALNIAPAPVGLRSNVPEAIKNFAAAVPDVVGQNNPMLAENRIVPRELEQDIRASRQDEMVQSYDSIPSAMSGTRSKKSGQSKTVNLFEETLEVVNFLNLMTLKIIP